MPSTGKFLLSSGTTMGRLLIAAAVVVAFVLGFMIRGGGSSGPAGPAPDHEAASEATTWTCSMHPQIQLPSAGQCPLCFMDLIPLENDGEAEDLGPRSLVLSASAAALADIETATVEQREVNSTLPLIGKVDYDETIFRTISAWVPGRIDTLFVDFTGTKVARGERLVSLYSPELYAAQAELLNAVRAEEDLRHSPDDLMRETARATVDAARKRLNRWGLTMLQIERIVDRGEALDHLDITSPLGGVVLHKAAMEGMYVKTGTQLYTVADLSRVWVTLNAYESDLLWLKEGQTIEFTVEALPGRDFAGEIIFIDPVLNSKTRTALVRIDVDNAEGILKPGMFVNAEARAGYGSTAVSDKSLPLVIPATAPMITGKRSVVYVRVPGTEKPTFEGREVVLGPRVGDWYIVESGLTAGEAVVTRGNFKIDSALQIQAKPSMMSAVDEEEVPMIFGDVSEDFHAQLATLLAAYLEVQTALADDDDGVARLAANGTGTALEKIDRGLLDGDARDAWLSDVIPLRASITKLAAAEGMEIRRNALISTTENLWAVLNKYGFSPEKPTRLFHCPMANNNTGANWLQESTTTENPYFGASMLRCGSQVDSIPRPRHEQGGS